MHAFTVAKQKKKNNKDTDTSNRGFLDFHEIKLVKTPNYSTTIFLYCLEVSNKSYILVKFFQNKNLMKLDGRYFEQF